MSGWGSWLSSAADSSGAAAAAAAPNFKPVSDQPQDQLYGQLTPSDLEWTCAGGFTTETQTWYSILEDGSFATSQIIHSAVGLWYPQIQITFKYFNPNTGKKLWKSVNVSNFVTPPPAGTGRDKAKTHDKRSCKADQFSVLFETLPNGDESYAVEANMDKDLQLSWNFKRSAANLGWKLGQGPNGGKSIFGNNSSSPDGYVVHRFWPRAESSGHIIAQGQAIDAKGQGMFVHAIQGMRPNLVASKWNFANFQSEELGGIAAIMMEFTTTAEYGDPAGAGADGAPLPRKSLTVNIGSVSVGGKLAAVTASTSGRKAGEPTSSEVKHLETVQDAETGYPAPTKIKYAWQGPALDAQHTAHADQVVKAQLEVGLGKPFPTSESKGLIDKVDVLAEIPYVVRKVVNYVAGTKPYIYQTINPATLSLTLPADSANPGTHEAQGILFEEHTFINV